MSWQRPLFLAVLVSTVSLVAGCVAAPGADVPRAPSAGGDSASAAAKTGDRIYLRNAGPDGALVVLDADTGAELSRLPAGINTPDWSLVYGAEDVDGTTTVIRATDVAKNAVTGERRIESAHTFQLPAVSFTGEPGGFSPNARWLALADGGHVDYAAKGAPTKTTFAVLDSKLQQPATVVELPGTFSFDAISDSGANLYVEEHLGNNGDDGYRVRVYDLRAGQLMPDVVVDKAGNASGMAGTRVGTLASPDGTWQYTLYWRQGGNPFIHAIKLEERWSLCLFLPVQTSGEQDFAWSFVASPDGRTAYAVNNLKGYVAQISLTNASVIKTATFDAQQAAAPSLGESIARFFLPVAEAKSEMFSQSVVSPDGQTVWATGDFGRKLFALRTDTLAVRARYSIDLSSGNPVQTTALGISADGKRLYGIAADRRLLLRIDAATGKVIAEVSLARPIAGRILRIAAP